MTQHEWQYLESVIGAMSPDEKLRLVTIVGAPRSETAQTEDAKHTKAPDLDFLTASNFLSKSRDEQMELLRQLADERKRWAALHEKRLAEDASATSEADDPWIGCMADESDLLDEIMEGVYHAREHHPFRAVE